MIEVSAINYNLLWILFILIVVIIVDKIIYYLHTKSKVNIFYYLPQNCTDLAESNSLFTIKY